MNIGKAGAIAGTSIKQIFRDRTTIFFTMLFPLVIIFVIGVATADLGSSEVPLGIVDEGSGPLGTELREAIGRSPLLDLERYDGTEDLRRDVRRGVVVAGVLIPSSYDAALRAGKEAEVEFVSDPSHGFPAVVRTAMAAAAADQGSRLQAAQFATEQAGGDFDRNLETAGRTERVFRAVEVDGRSLGTAGGRFLMSGFEYTAPANLTLFVFITSLAASAQIIEARRLGVTRRMLSTPTTAGTILAGHTLGRFGVAIFQGIYILALGLFVFGVDFGDPLGAAAVVLLFVMVGTTFGVLFGTIFRTPEQAGSIGPTAGIAMGMLAGCMWPPFIMPEPMQRIGQLFPHSWAMDAWIKLIARGAGVSDILPQLAVLAAFVVALLPVAAWRLRRSIVAG